MRLQDKVCLITSAQNPCADALATAFAREGAHCIILDQDAGKAQALASRVQAGGRRALGIEADVTRKNQVEAAVGRAVAEFGRIDVLLNCSAVTIENGFLEFTEDDFNACFERGPKAYFLACQAVGRQMAEQRSGKIINLSTIDARIASGESTGNSAAYSSIDAMTRAIAQALGFYGVNVNALVCGPMEYPPLSAEEAGERLRRIPVGRLGRAEDLVGAAIFLATDDANFICGESLYVDAGYSNAAVTEDGFRPAWGRTWGTFQAPPRGR
jgi:NAD(P)-dependent dehydrogenase (short-subunit alcohol dehydrogenase family)